MKGGWRAGGRFTSPAPEYANLHGKRFTPGRRPKLRLVARGSLRCCRPNSFRQAPWGSPVAPCTGLHSYPLAHEDRAAATSFFLPRSFFFPSSSSPWPPPAVSSSCFLVAARQLPFGRHVVCDRLPPPSIPPIRPAKLRPAMAGAYLPLFSPRPWCCNHGCEKLQPVSGEAVTSAASCYNP